MHGRQDTGLGTTPEQWGHARVNAFIVKKKKRKSKPRQGFSMKTLREQAVEVVLLDLQETKTNILDNPYRLGSTMYFEVIKEKLRDLQKKIDTD